MLLNFVAWIYMAVLAYCYGWASWTAFVALSSKGVVPQMRVSLPLKLILGVGTLAVLATLLSLWISIGREANLILCLIAISIIVVKRRAFIRAVKEDFSNFNQQLSLADMAILMISALLIFQSSVGPYNYDTGLYHLQATKWIEQYGTVPGLGNLHTRLAFGSIWFPLAALFSFSDILPQPLHSVNGFLLSLCILFSLSRIRPLATGSLSAARVVQLLAAIPLIHLIYERLRFSVEVSSLSTDMPVAAIILVILILSVHLREGEIEQPQIPIYLASVAYLTLIAIAIKVSAFPISLVTLYLFIHFHRQVSPRLLLLIASLSVITLLPLLLRNVITSGYLIYPFYQLDLFTVDWKIPLETAMEDRLSLGAWVKAPGKTAEEIAAGDWSYWLPGWWSRISQSWVIKAWPVAILFFLMSWFAYKPAVQTIIKRWQWLYGVLILSIVIWFFQSPDIRLGYGFLAGLPLLLIAPGFTQLLEKISTKRKTPPLVMTVYVYSCLFFSIAKFNFYPTDFVFLTLPMDYPPAKVQSRVINDVTVHWPLEGDQCWNAELPCLNRFSDSWRLRGETLNVGFRPDNP